MNQVSRLRQSAKQDLRQLHVRSRHHHCILPVRAGQRQLVHESRPSVFKHSSHARRYTSSVVTSSTTQAPQVSREPGTWGSRPMRNAAIGTLDPGKLTREDHIDISGTQCVRVSDRYRPDGDSRISAQLSAVEFPHALFPPHTAGFLYYYQHPPPAPPCAGEIRFRLTPNVEPVGFSAGRDLTLPSGLPWRRPLIGLEKKRLGRVRGMLYPMLQRDGLVSPEVLALASNLKVTAHSTIIHSFGQPFEMALNSRKTITILGRKEVAKLTLRPFILRSERRGLAAVQQTAPYLGTAICHFQRTVSLGWRDTLNLRVEKYVEGPTRNPDFVLPRGTTWADFPPAQAGELVRLHTYYMLKPRSKEVEEREVGGRDMQRPFWLRYSHKGESRTEAEEECEGENKGVRRPFWLRYSHQGNMALRLLLENEPPDPSHIQHCGGHIG